MGDFPEVTGRAICTVAIRECRCGEMFDCLFDGGSATVDAATGKLVLIPAAALAQFAEADTPSCPHVVSGDEGTAYCALAAAHRPTLYCPACGINRHWQEEDPGVPVVDQWPGTGMALPCPRCGVEACPVSAEGLVGQYDRRWRAGEPDVEASYIAGQEALATMLRRSLDRHIGPEARPVTEGDTRG